MRKLKYILASVVLAAGFASCETEPIDEQIKDETHPGNPILSFDLNAKQTIVTEKATITFTATTANVEARLSILNTEDTSNPHTRYKPARLTIQFTALEVAHFPTTLSVDNPSNFTSRATLSVQEYDDEGRLVWVNFSTGNAPENQDAGFANITHVNGEAEFIHGNFNYILFPIEGSIYQPQRITDGSFNYINY